MRPASLFLLIFLSIFLPAARAADPFEIKDGDRVLFLGDVLLEREGTYGYLETRMHEQFPDRKFTVRNLAMSGDTPLGWSRASFDPPDKGFDRLKEQLALVKPTVVFLGYGMAASLQEMTDRSGDITLNRDVERYGTETYSVGRFKKEMGQLMDAINATDPATKVRFVLLSPIRHEDLRASKPGLPDPAEHNKVLEQYGKAIEELAKERNGTFVDLGNVAKKPNPRETTLSNTILKNAGIGQPPTATENGIHLTSNGYVLLSEWIASDLGWNDLLAKKDALASAQYNASLRAAIIKKNELFFHRWRPENHTYLFGFRKYEQGQNAKEIPEFDPLIDAAEAEIDKLKRAAKTAGTPPKAPETPVAAVAPAVTAPAPADTLPLPKFDLDPSLEMTLWAENPLLEKPTEMNWDAAGRLWVCSSGLYPQIAPGVAATDQIILIEDTDHDGKPDKSTVFADGLLIPTGVESDNTADGKLGCYVGQSTELLHFRDTDGDGKADEKRIILSGFGTEDTHHILHTLRWGPDGRLYFDQSIYIHSHLETPWGLIRMNSAAVMAYDPRTERVQVCFKGLCNPWGHAWDKFGQEFLTDGAGGGGINWGVPQAMYFTYENGKRILQSVSPGSYPKFAGLELIQSPHFPADWQGDAITCDFRAHRIVRFHINDLSTGDKPQSGYVTKDMPDICRTADVSFRPIDVKLGPDGALYVADWSNPVINHGEVDFRDPRRDHTHGRIWRIAYKGGPVAKQPEFTAEAKALSQFRLSPPLAESEALAASKVPRERIEGMRALCRHPSPRSATLVLTTALNAPEGDPFYTYAAALSINDLADVWTAAIAKGEWVADSPEKQKQLAWGLANIRADLANSTLAKLVADNKVPLDGSGPWIELLGQSGGPKELDRLWTAVNEKKIQETVTPRTLAALTVAALQRNVRPTLPLNNLGGYLETENVETTRTATRLAGAWKMEATVPRLLALTSGKDDATRNYAFEALRAIGSEAARAGLRQLAAAPNPPSIRGQAVATLAPLDLNPALTFEALAAQPSEDAALAVWRGILAAQDAGNKLAAVLPKDLPPNVAKAALRAAREAGQKGTALVNAIAGSPSAPPPRDVKADIKHYSEVVVTNGHPIEGEAIYHRIGCVQCHSISGAGGKFGPDFTSLGASAPIDYIVESVLDPAAKVKEGFTAFAFTLKDGTQMNGIPTRETATEQFIRVGPGPEISLTKGNIAKRDSVGSMMPAALTDALSATEKENLFAFLTQVGKPGPFDASKSNVARVWWLFPSSVLASAVKPGADVPSVIANVNGALPKQRLTDALPLIANPGDGPKAVTRFQVANPGKVKLNLTGIREAWLDGQGLPVASEPSPTVDLAAGAHTLAVRLDPKALPETMRVESADVRFLTE